MKKMLILIGALIVGGVIFTACSGQAAPTTVPGRQRKNLRTARRITPAHGGR